MKSPSLQNNFCSKSTNEGVDCYRRAERTNDSGERRSSYPEEKRKEKKLEGESIKIKGKKWGSHKVSSEGVND